MYLSPDSDLDGSHSFSVVWGILSPGTEEILLSFAPFAFHSLYNGILGHSCIFLLPFLLLHSHGASST